MPPAKIIPAIVAAAIVSICIHWTTKDALALNIGKFEIHPFASVTETFTDNVFTTAVNEHRDLVTKYMPGATVGFPFSMHRLDLSYNAVLMRYDEFRSEKTNDHHGRGTLDLKFGSRFNLVLSDSYHKDHEPRGSSTTGFIQKYTTNTGKGSLVYQLVDRSKVQVDYSKTSWTFKREPALIGTVLDPIYRDRREGLVAAYLYYRFLPKTSAFIEYDVKKVDFSESTSPYDNTMTSALVGLTWEASSSSKGTIKAGRTSKNFEDSIIKDHETWTSSVDIKHEFSRYTSVVITGQRTINESNRLGTRFYVTTGIYGEAVHTFGYHLSAVVHGSTGTDVYSDVIVPATVKRKDDVASWGGGLKYLVQEWLVVSVDYVKRSRDSNIDIGDFKENQYNVMISIML